MKIGSDAEILSSCNSNRQMNICREGHKESHQLSDTKVSKLDQMERYSHLLVLAEQLMYAEEDLITNLVSDGSMLNYP